MYNATITIDIGSADSPSAGDALHTWYTLLIVS